MQYQKWFPANLCDVKFDRVSNLEIINSINCLEYRRVECNGAESNIKKYKIILMCRIDLCKV